MEHISNTAVKTFLTCPRKYWYKYKLELSPKERPSYQIDGTLLHSAIEKYYLFDRTKIPNFPLFKFVEWGFPESKLPALNNVFEVIQDVPLSVERRARMIGMFAGYVLTYPKEEFTNYRPEESIEFDWNGTPIICKLDNIVSINGVNRLLEIKTSSDYNIMERADRLSDDIQALFYLWAYYMTRGSFLNGVLFRIVKKCRLRQGKNETDEEYSDRIIKEYITKPKDYFLESRCEKSVDDLLWFQDELEQHIIDINRERKIWVRNTQRCFDYGGCDYYSLCEHKELDEGFINDRFTKGGR